MNFEVLKSSWSDKILIPTPSSTLFIFFPTAHGVLMPSIPSFLCHCHLAPFCCLNALFLSNAIIWVPLFIRDAFCFSPNIAFPYHLLPFCNHRLILPTTAFSLIRLPPNILLIKCHAPPRTPQSLKLFPSLCSLPVPLSCSVISYLASELLSLHQKRLLQFNRYPLSTHLVHTKKE